MVLFYSKRNYFSFRKCQFFKNTGTGTVGIYLKLRFFFVLGLYGSDPDDLIGSWSCKKVRIRWDPDPQRRKGVPVSISMYRLQQIQMRGYRMFNMTLKYLSSFPELFPSSWSRNKLRTGGNNSSSVSNTLVWTWCIRIIITRSRRRLRNPGPIPQWTHYRYRNLRQTGFLNTTTLRGLILGWTSCRNILENWAKKIIAKISRRKKKKICYSRKS